MKLLDRVTVGVVAALMVAVVGPASAAWADAPQVDDQYAACRTTSGNQFFDPLIDRFLILGGTATGELDWYANDSATWVCVEIAVNGGDVVGKRIILPASTPIPGLYDDAVAAVLHVGNDIVAPLVQRVGSAATYRCSDAGNQIPGPHPLLDLSNELPVVAGRYYADVWFDGSELRVCEQASGALNGTASYWFDL